MRLIDFKSYVGPVSTGVMLVAAGLSAGGQVASGLFKPSLKRQWKYQQKQMKLQQQYALEQMQKQGEINYANWQKQFDYENAYNDPTKVFDRYLKAGVTPAAVLGSSGVGVNATMSGGSSGSVVSSGASGRSWYCAFCLLHLFVGFEQIFCKLFWTAVACAHLATYGFCELIPLTFAF